MSKVTITPNKDGALVLDTRNPLFKQIMVQTKVRRFGRSGFGNSKATTAFITDEASEIAEIIAEARANNA